VVLGLEIASFCYGNIFVKLKTTVNTWAMTNLRSVVCCADVITDISLLRILNLVQT